MVPRAILSKCGDRLGAHRRDRTSLTPADRRRAGQQRPGAITPSARRRRDHHDLSRHSRPPRRRAISIHQHRRWIRSHPAPARKFQLARAGPHDSAPNCIHEGAVAILETTPPRRLAMELARFAGAANSSAPPPPSAGAQGRHAPPRVQRLSTCQFFFGARRHPKRRVQRGQRAIAPAADRGDKQPPAAWSAAPPRHPSRRAINSSIKARATAAIRR